MRKPLKITLFEAPRDMADSETHLENAYLSFIFDVASSAAAARAALAPAGVEINH